MSKTIKATDAYSASYEVEVEYTERGEDNLNKTGTIKIPYISSDQYFNLIGSEDLSRPGINEFQAIALLGRNLLEMLVPGIIKRITPRSATKIMETILEVEKETLGLGELLGSLGNQTELPAIV